MLQNHNITKKTKATAPEGCSSCIQLPAYSSYGTAKMTEKQCACVDSSYYASFVFGDGLTIEGIGNDGKEIPAKTNAWGGSTGYFKVTATKDTDVTYLVNYIYVYDPDDIIVDKTVSEQWKFDKDRTRRILNSVVGGYDELVSPISSVVIIWESDTTHLKTQCDWDRYIEQRFIGYDECISC